MPATVPSPADQSPFYTPSGRYFADASDCALQSKWELERQQREAERFRRYLERHLAAPAAELEDPYAAPAPRLARQRNTRAPRYGVRRRAGGAA